MVDSSLDHRRAYGLEIHSALPLPELLPGKPGRPDIEVSLGPVSHERMPVAVGEDRYFWAARERVCHMVGGVGSFLVRAGRQVVVEAEDGAPSELVRLSLLGPALALALLQRSVFVLHASSVAVGGSAVAFLGGFAAGKSTLVAGLHRLGNTLVSDDVTGVIFDGQDPRILPSFPQIKLWPDAARSVGISPDELPRVHPDHDKRKLRVERAFAETPPPLQRLYVLAVGEAVSIDPLPGARGFEEILKHWYGGRFGPELLRVIDPRDLFRSAARLARHVRVKRLTRPATLGGDLEPAGAIQEAIRGDLQGALAVSAAAQRQPLAPSEAT